MTRRTAYVLVAVTIAAAAAAWFALGTKRPNVVIVVMDTTRADRCSFLGYGRPTTPRLAELAKTSVSFADAWAPSCWTGPSHATLFTGLLPAKHGFRDGGRQFLTPAETTLAERLKAAGYATRALTNNVVVSNEFGLLQGFDAVDPLFKDQARPYPWAADTHARALAWAKEQKAAGKPFFLFVNDMEPHLEYDPPAAASVRFVTGSPTPQEDAEARRFQYPWSVAYNLGVLDVSPRQLALLSDLYDAEIAALDAELGTLFDGLGAAGLLDDTIVVVCADHGESLGEHRRLGHLFTIHRQTLHVPLLVRFPGHFDGGRRVTDTVRLEDVAPTILTLAGLGVPPDLDGRSLTGDLAGRVAQAEFGDQTANLPELRSRLPAEMLADADLSMFSIAVVSAYDGRWHYLRDATGREELYDVTADPDETTNLAASDAAALARMRGLAAK